MSIIPKGDPIHLKQAKIGGVKADFPNKTVTITLKVPFGLNPNILQLAEEGLAFISFADMPVSVDIQPLQQTMDFTSGDGELKDKPKRGG